MPKQDDIEKQKKAFDEILKKQQQLLDLYSKTSLNSLENANKKYSKIIENSTEKHKVIKDRFNQIYGGSWERLLTRVSLSFNNMVRDMTREAGRGGFGDLGVEVGKKMGSNIGTWMTKAFGGVSPAVGARIGSLLGGSVVAGLQSLEGVRMLGAKFMPVITAGREQRTDFGKAGAEMLTRTIRIQQETGAAREEVFALASEMSKLGIPFDQVGEKAVQYAIAAEKVMNLERGTVKTLDTLAVTKYGQAWGDVAEVLKNVSSSQEYWNTVAKQTHSSLANSLSSNQTLVKMYSEVLTAMQGSSFETKGMGDALLGTVNVMGQMGLRPGMMASVSKEFISKVAPKTQGDVATTVTQGYFLSDLLRRSSRGMQILSAARGIQERMHLDPNLITLPLNQLLSSNDAMTGQYFGALLEGIGSMRDQMQGSEVQRQTSALLRLQATLGTSPTTSFVMLSMADQYRSNINKGMRPEEAWHAIGKSEAYQKSVEGTEYSGLDPQEVFKLASGMGSASLSTEQKLSLAAESLAALAGDKFFSQLRTEGKSLFDEAAMKLLRPDKAVSRLMPPTVSVGPQPFEMGPTGQQLLTANPPSKKVEMRPMFGYTKSTSRGIEQVTVSTDIEALAQGIGQVESRGRYGSMGPVISDPSSRWFMDRAYGKYQVMGGNVPKWTKEALGESMSPQEFVRNPEAQEKTAKFQMEKMRKKGYSNEDIASIWHSGVPLAEAKKRNKVDVATGLPTETYVKKVMAASPRTS